ncbi:MAG TPA: transglutaminase-like domain-containing protein [Allosphingosinicella sp.]|nr:transglutaminase-like domain-containing protein [Allosphingosinicella sp.]
MACLPAAAPAARTLAEVSRAAIGDAATAAARVRAVIAWTHANLDWTTTDYQDRTPEQVLARGGGNCHEQARLVRALLAPAGVETRLVREINVQPASERRQRDAEEMIARTGPRASVFGARHNDHVWTEYRDVEQGEWVPADPTLNVVGIDAWVRARLGFGPRPVHEIIPYADMLFPVAVVAPLAGGRFEGRSERLLVRGFAAHVPGVAARPGWARWAELVSRAEALVILTMQGRHNLHDDGALLEELSRAYAALRPA